MILKLLSQKNLIYILIVSLSFLLYGNSLQNKYALDDAIVINENDFVKEGVSGIKSILTTELFTGFFGVKKNLVEGGRYRPLSLISFAIEYELFGENPFIGHLLNILFYALTGIVLYRLLFFLFTDRFKNEWDILIPFMATLLWLFHPLHTEVIANIKGRDEIFSLLGSLLSLQLILSYLKNQKWYWLVLSALVFFLALLSKEMTITFLAIIPLSLYFFTNKTLKEILLPSILLLIPTFIFLYLRQSIMGEPAVTGASVPKELMNHSFLGSSLADQYATVSYTLLLYLKLLFVPYPLTFDYYPYHITITTFSNPWVLLSLIIHSSLAFIAIKGLKEKSLLSFGILYYAITFSIVSNILFPIGTFMSERFMYMPSIGWAIIVAFGIMKITQIAYSKNIKITQIPFVLLFLVPFVALTINRNKAWKNDYILFTTDVETSVGSAKSNTSAGGKIIEEVDKLEKILRDKTLSINTISKSIQKLDLRGEEKERLLEGENIQQIRENIKQFDKEYLEKSLYYLNRAIEIHPTYTDALLLLGNAHYKYNKDYDNCWLAYEKILKQHPNHKLASKNWLIILSDSIPVRQKITYYQKLLKYNPNIFEANYQVGNLYGRQLNQLDSSIIYLEKARQISPNKAKVFKDLGVAYGMSQQYDKALPIMLEAHNLDPNDYQILLNIGITYQILNDIENANKYENKDWYLCTEKNPNK